MRIRLITGLFLLAAMPVAAQEASDSTRVFAVPATTPAVPNPQVLLDPRIEAALATMGTTRTAGANALVWVTMAGLGLCLLRRYRGEPGNRMFPEEALQF